MSVWDRWARAINGVITGDKRRRTMLTPIAAIIFFGIITLFVLASSWVDRWLNLPHLPEVWWRYALATIIFISGLLIAGWSVSRFFMARGTPVPLIVFFAPLPVLLYALWIKAVQEPELEMRFGQDYREYKKRVPMFIPRFKKH